MTDTAGRPEFTYVSPQELRFDPTNPRFGGVARSKSQEEIQNLLEKEPHYALHLVDSFLENGFIDYEPLVVRRDGAHYVVIEGNRRLAAVRHILANREQYGERSTRIDDLLSIPVLVFPATSGPQEEKEQRVYLGVRHLFGFREWPAESKARFLDSNIKSKRDLERTMLELNIKKTEIRRYLIPYRLRRAAKRLWEPYGSQEFWILGESLNRKGIKEYIELAVDNDSLALRGFNEQKLSNLLEFVYGPPEGGKGKKRIRETRDLSRLANVLEEKRAVAVLEKGGSLDEAQLFIESPKESLNRLADLIRELGLLLRRVLGPGKREAVKMVLQRFASFEESAKQFLRNARKPRV
jgi:hypothetical protein